MKDVPGNPTGDSKSLYLGVISQTVRSIGQFGELTLHDSLPEWKPSQGFLHDTIESLKNAWSLNAITVLRMLPRLENILN